MAKSNFKRVWIQYEIGLSFGDMKALLPNVLPRHGVQDNITRLTVMENLYDPKTIVDIFFDELKGTSVFHSGYDLTLATFITTQYKENIMNFGYKMDADSDYTYNQMLLSLSEDLENKISENMNNNN